MDAKTSQDLISNCFRLGSGTTPHVSHAAVPSRGYVTAPHESHTAGPSTTSHMSHTVEPNSTLHEAGALIRRCWRTSLRREGSEIAPEQGGHWGGRKERPSKDRVSHRASEDEDADTGGAGRSRVYIEGVPPVVDRNATTILEVFLE